jgi:hypothetical protein
MDIASLTIANSYHLQCVATTCFSICHSHSTILLEFPSYCVQCLQLAISVTFEPSEPLSSHCIALHIITQLSLHCSPTGFFSKGCQRHSEGQEFVHIERTPLTYETSLICPIIPFVQLPILFHRAQDLFSM